MTTQPDNPLPAIKPGEESWAMVDIKHATSNPRETVNPAPVIKVAK